MRDWRRVSIGRWALALVLIVANLHWCREQFFLPDGALCGTCPTLEHKDSLDFERALTATDNHGDCHDCCTIKPCDDETPDDVAAKASSLTVHVAVLSEGPKTLPTILLGVVKREYLILAGHPPTGPPASIFGRGPPSLS